MRIAWTDPALLDLENIRDYIRKDSEHYAARFIEKIIKTVENLDSFPLMGRHVPEAEEENIRELLLYNYRIMYRVETGRILERQIYDEGIYMNSMRSENIIQIFDSLPEDKKKRSVTLLNF